MEDLVSKDAKLSWGAEEDCIELVADNEALDSLEATTVLGRLFTKRAFTTNHLRDMLRCIWRAIMGWSLQELVAGLYVIRFTKREHLDSIMRHRTWMLSGPTGALLALFDWPQSGEWDKVETSSLLIWTQVHGLPLMFMTEASVTKLVAKAGSLLEVHGSGHEGIMGWKFLRFKVLVDLNKPLYAGCFMPCPDGRKVWAQYHYERIAALCNKCGVIGHDHHWCFKEPVLIKSSEGDMRWKYGSWLRSEASAKDCFGSPPPSSSDEGTHSASQEDIRPIPATLVAANVQVPLVPRPQPIPRTLPKWVSRGSGNVR